MISSKFGYLLECIKNLNVLIGNCGKKKICRKIQDILFSGFKINFFVFPAEI